MKKLILLIAISMTIIACESDKKETTETSETVSYTHLRAHETF